MRVFVTGATGFLGSAIVSQLINAGHQVLGLTRSEASARSLLKIGAQAHIGDIDDLDSLRRGVSLADAVIHTAFNHDFSTFAANCEADRQAIEAMGSALYGSDRPLIITSIAGLGAMIKGQLASEEYFNADSPNPRKASELASISLAQRGINVSVVRLPQVHDRVKQGLISPLIELAREKGVSAYIGEGENRWAAVHISDAARLYVLVLEKHLAGSRYHAVAEQGISLRNIAEVIGRGLNIPVKSLDAHEGATHFGWINTFISHDMSASGALTQQRLSWRPSGPDLLTDLEQMHYL